MKKKIVAAEVILWVTALVAISNINWGGFFWCFSLMILGYLAFLAVDAEEKRKKTEAEKGSWITLAEWVEDEEKGRYVPVCVKTEYVDGEKIKEDTYYTLKSGEFVEVEE